MAVAVTLTRPVHHATLPEISETTGDLTASNAASGTVEAAATLLGPLACALLIGPVGPGGVIVGTAAVAAAGAVSTATLGRQGRTPGGPTVPTLRVGETLRAVVADPAARTLVGLTAALYVLVGMIDILIVVLAIDLLGMGNSGPGLLTAVIGLGALLGASLTFVLVGRARLATLLVTAGVVAGGSFAFAGTAGSVAVAAALVALTGAGRLFFDVTTRTFEQRLLPDRLLVALFGIQEAVMMAGMAVGSVLAPLLVELLGARAALRVRVAPATAGAAGLAPTAQVRREHGRAARCPGHAAPRAHLDGPVATGRRTPCVRVLAGVRAGGACRGDRGRGG